MGEQETAGSHQASAKLSLGVLAKRRSDGGEVMFLAVIMVH